MNAGAADAAVLVDGIPRLEAWSAAARSEPARIAGDIITPAFGRERKKSGGVGRTDVEEEVKAGKVKQLCVIQSSFFFASPMPHNTSCTHNDVLGLSAIAVESSFPLSADERSLTEIRQSGCVTGSRHEIEDSKQRHYRQGACL